MFESVILVRNCSREINPVSLKMTDSTWTSNGCPKSCLTDCTFKSEYSHEYKYIPKSSYTRRFELPVPCSRFILPQELYERGNRLLPKYSKCNSTYRSDFKLWERPDNRSEISRIIRSKPDHQYVDIDVDNGGFEKYLDIYATTKSLDHRPFSSNEVKHDAITVWDWLKIPKVRGRTIPLEVRIPQRDLRNESKINQPKRNHLVPNRGLVSEYQGEFVNHRSP